MVPLLKGELTYRSCFVVSTESVFYATDTPLWTNGIYYCWDCRSGPEFVYTMLGPCIYGNVFRNGNVVMVHCIHGGTGLLIAVVMG